MMSFAFRMGGTFLRTTVLLLLALAVAGCSSTGYKYADGERKVLYGVDGSGNALYRRPGEPPARASGASVCLSYRGCSPDAEDQTAAKLN